jgi:hypothetical protein
LLPGDEECGAVDCPTISAQVFLARTKGVCDIGRGWRCFVC